MKNFPNSWNLETLLNFSVHEKFRRAPYAVEYTKTSWLYSESEYFQALRKLKECKPGKTYLYKLFLFEEAGNRYLRISKYRKRQEKDD